MSIFAQSFRRLIDPCCEDMHFELTKPGCDQHEDCPDTLLRRLDSGEVGIIIHDGGSSVRVIRFCPFCGGRQFEMHEEAPR